jgi:hypothetical protein
MAVDRDPQHLALYPAVEALNETIGLRRVWLGPAVLHLQLAAGLLEAIGGKAGSSVRQDVRGLEGECPDGRFQEGDRACGQLIVLDCQVHPARAAVDGHIQILFAALAISGLHLGQVFDVHVHETKIVVLERAHLALALLRRRQAAQTLSLEDVVDGILVEMRQEVGDHKGEIMVMR